MKTCLLELILPFLMPEARLPLLQLQSGQSASRAPYRLLGVDSAAPTLARLGASDQLEVLARSLSALGLRSSPIILGDQAGNPVS